MVMAVDTDRILEALRSAGRPLATRELARALGEGAPKKLEKQLEALERDGVLYRNRSRRWALPRRINLVAGTLSTTRSGAGFVTPDEPGQDIYIRAEGLGSALDGDRVVVRVEKRPTRGRGPEGRVIRVLERARGTVVGTFHPVRSGRRTGFGFVVPQDPRLRRDVYVPAADIEEGDIVQVRVTDWGDGQRGPTGEVQRVLGRRGDPGVDVLAVALSHELPLEFPPEVEAEAERIAQRGLRPEDYEGRTDLRDDLIFTIDPADAKDHDDAVSVRSVENDALEVGIHIADLSHYVREGTALDAEALSRATSVYLVDRVVPMLPHPLSSGLCSLVPGEDRLTLSLFVRIDADGSVHAPRLVQSVIRSRHRLSYDDAQAVLDGSGHVDDETDAALRGLAQAAQRLRAKRMERGSLDFDLPESRVVLNAAGEPTDIQRVLRLESHRLIEDLMLIANETIARRAAGRKLPFIYRIHERPDPARMEQLAEFAARLGLRLDGAPTPTPSQVQRLLRAAEGRPEEDLLAGVALRSMKQARYSHENAGHFGLAARAYTHFTSPIRRYPDLVVHRLCRRYFLGGDGARPQPEELEAIAATSSERERNAVAAERDSIDLKKVEFMEQHLGEVFEGTIANVRPFGFFVLLDRFHVEGLVHVSTLDDFFVYAEDEWMLVGERTRRRYRLGDRCRVRVAAVDREQRSIDFQLVGDRPARAGTRRGLTPRRKRQ